MLRALVLLALTVPAIPLCGQSRDGVFHAESSLVLVPVTVTGRNGATLQGLTQEDFSVFEDKIPQPIVSFGAQDAPCSVGIVLDASGSMLRLLNRSRIIVDRFLREADPQDRFSLWTVSTRPAGYEGFTSDLTALWKQVMRVKAGGYTALIDTVYLSVNRVRSARNSRRALLVISDGMDNHSRYTAGELLRVAAEFDVQIYTVAVGTGVGSAKAVWSQEERRGRWLLEEIAGKTGGMSYALDLDSDEEISLVAAKIGQAIRNQYLIGYQPRDTSSSDRWRTIQVKLHLPHATVNARSGCYR